MVKPPTENWLLAVQPDDMFVLPNAMQFANPLSDSPNPNNIEKLFSVLLVMLLPFPNMNPRVFKAVLEIELSLPKILELWLEFVL